MPIKIRQIHFKATVGMPKYEKGSGLDNSFQTIGTQQLIAACTEQVMRRLNKQKQR